MANEVSIILELERMIKSHLSSIEKLEEEFTKHNDMLNDIFENDAVFKEHSEKAKEATRIKTNTKKEIMKQAQVADLAQKVKGFKTEIKELEGALSDYLREFQKMSGVNEIEGEDGELREIIYTAKLVRKSFRKD